MALTQENVHYTLNSCPGVMNKSRTGFMRGSRIFVRRGGGGGGEWGSRPDGQKTVWTMFFSVINLFYSLQSGSNGFITEGRRGPTSSRGWGCPKKPIELVIFQCQGGSGSPNPPLDPYVGSPDATICLQNHGLSKFK